MYRVRVHSRNVGYNTAAHVVYTTYNYACACFGVPRLISVAFYTSKYVIAFVFIQILPQHFQRL